MFKNMMRKRGDAETLILNRYPHEFYQVVHPTLSPGIADDIIVNPKML